MTDIGDWLERIVGPYRLVADRSWDHGESHVLELRDAAGVTWFAKRHRTADHHTKELAAYQLWVPALGERAPQLRAHDPDRQVLLLSSVPGIPQDDDGTTPAIHREAGRLLRLLHDAAAPQPWPDFAADQQARFDKWLPRTTPLLDQRSIDFVAGQLRDLAGVVVTRVPCHLDYSPRNWLVADGVVHVIDFEMAALNWWLRDMSRLYFGMWQDRPDTYQAFLDGYGRQPTDDDLAVLHALGALESMTTIAWAREHDDPGFEAYGRRNLAALHDQAAR